MLAISQNHSDHRAGLMYKAQIFAKICEYDQHNFTNTFTKLLNFHLLFWHYIYKHLNRKTITSEANAFLFEYEQLL